MKTNFVCDNGWTTDGLDRLREEAFGSEGFAHGASELVDVLVHRTTSTFWRGQMYQDGKRVRRGSELQFSEEALAEWLDECHTRAYKPGLGTWVTAEVHIYPDRPGELNLFDEEHLERASNGEWYPGGWPSDSTACSQQLLVFPRTEDHIPLWMWDIFREEGMTPPIYNPEFKSVDWKNRRRPVTDRGTDFSVEPTVIDPALDPGVLSRIGKKLFGSRS